MGAGGDEFTKALALLVHDLRAPLSVASGYLRLIREDRLTSDEDRERAFTGVLEAVKRISRLCDEASDFGSAHESAEVATSLVKAGELAERVCAVLQSEGAAVEPRAENNGEVRESDPDRPHRIGGGQRSSHRPSCSGPSRPGRHGGCIGRARLAVSGWHSH